VSSLFSIIFYVKAALPALQRKGAAVLFVLLCLLVPAERGWAEYLQFGEDLFVNLPASWQVQGIEENKFSAGNQAEEAYFLLKQHAGGHFQDINQMHSTVAAELSARVYAGSSYSYSGMDAHLSQVEFQQQDRRFQGYLLCIESHRIDVVVVGFALMGKLSTYQDTLFQRWIRWLWETAVWLSRDLSANQYHPIRLRMLNALRFNLRAERFHWP